MSEQIPCLRNSAGRPVVATRFRVRFFETDAMGIVHHASYITWFEEGRSAFTRAIGYPYSQMAADGLNLAVVEVVANYRSPAHYDDEIIVVTCLEQIRSRGMTFSYEVRRAEDGQILATGSSKHVAIDEEGRAAQIPPTIRARLSGSGGG